MSFSILEVYQQKSLNLSDNTTMSVSLHNYNFERNLFSGDPHQAHQFIPLLQSKLGEAKLSYILKTDAIPQPEECMLILERLHKEALQEAASKSIHEQIKSI